MPTVTQHPNTPPAPHEAVTRSPRKAGHTPSTTPMAVRIARALEETLQAIRHDLEAMAGGRLSPGEMRSAVSDFVDVHGDDPAAVREFRELPTRERERLLRQAVPSFSDKMNAGRHN